MSASVTVAAEVNSQLSPESGNIAIEPVETTGFLMKAGRWSPQEQKVIVTQVPVPKPGPNQFLVKLACASLCHSDIMAIDAGQTATLGHEGAGYIESMHPSVEDKGFSIGDKIGFLYIVGCCFGTAHHSIDFPTSKILTVFHFRMRSMHDTQYVRFHLDFDSTSLIRQGIVGLASSFCKDLQQMGSLQNTPWSIIPTASNFLTRSM